LELVLVRHALPVRLVAEEGERADPELAADGALQAEALTAWMRGERIDALYTSPLRRARETAAPLAAKFDLQPTIVADLAEWDRDAGAYITMEELKATGHDVWHAMRDGRFDDLGIDVEAFKARVITTLDGIAAAHPGERVLVVCHGGVINTYTADVLGLGSMLFFEPAYTSISRVLVSRGGARSLQSLNETGHLHHLG
jgi:broad specificity phosphatase PhoE